MPGAQVSIKSKYNMKTTTYDGEWLAFFDGEKEVAGFIAADAADYARLREEWESDELSWNAIVTAIKSICE